MVLVGAGIPVSGIVVPSEVEGPHGISGLSVNGRSLDFARNDTTF